MSDKEGCNSEKMRVAMAETVQTLSGRMRVLVEQVDDVLHNGHAGESSPEVVTALYFVQELAHTAQVVLEGPRGEVIFPKNSGLQVAEGAIGGAGMTSSAKPDLEGHDNGDKGGTEDIKKPTTFGELLRSRIAKLLPDRHYVAEDMASLLGKKRTLQMIEREMNLQGKGELTYEEAVDMVYQFLTTPTSLFKIKEGYDKSRLINSFHLFGGGLNGWSEQIGFVWEKGMTVSHDTAMQVRGLAQLDRLLKDEDKKD